MTVASDRGTASGNPVDVAIRLRPPESGSAADHFAATDPHRRADLTSNPRIARLVGSRKFQFLLILPNQIIFWAVILIGLFGTVVPGLNFGTAITWYLWFCLVFVMMVVVGRGWCAMCPFGGFAEWVQRQAFWRRTQRALGLGWKLPQSVAGYGFLISVGAFLLLTYIEEFFNIAGPGNPADTAWMVLGIVTSALVFFLLFERRTFCRYVCPLSALIGTVGAMGSVAGFRTRDRQVCLTCATKDCMRGGENGYGCPWYTWPGSADSNLACGLCSECYKACPSGNVGLYVQAPLTSVIAPSRRRADVAWGVMLLWGLVLYQQVNATTGYATVDNWLNSVISFPHYPNPVDYVGLIAVFALVMAAVAWLIARTFGRRDLTFDRPGSFQTRASKFRAFFAPLAYGLIPVVGADYFARQLPKFFDYSPRVLVSVGHLAGAGSTSSPLYSTSLLSGQAIVAVQVAVITVGALAAAWSSWRIAGRELVPISRGGTAVRIAASGLALGLGAVAATLYVIMHAAT
jgi:NosR/NirI family nitrous oxide reductase transcriptional regulator